MERETCLWCGGKALQMGQVKFQMGQYGFFLGALNHPISGALPADLSCCSDCKNWSSARWSSRKKRRALPGNPAPIAGNRTKSMIPNARTAGNDGWIEKILYHNKENVQ